MCTTIFIEDSGEVIQSQEELVTVLESTSGLVFKEEGESYDPATCLCPINVPATLEKAGVEVRSGWDDYATDYVMSVSI
jgi:hypothetical protein